MRKAGKEEAEALNGKCKVQNAKCKLDGRENWSVPPPQLEKATCSAGM